MAASGDSKSQAPIFLLAPGAGGGSQSANIQKWKRLLETIKPAGSSSGGGSATKQAASSAAAKLFAKPKKGGAAAAAATAAGADTATVVTLDYEGNQMAKLLVTHRKALAAIDNPSGRPVYIIGHSMGGRVGVHLSVILFGGDESAANDTTGVGKPPKSEKKTTKKKAAAAAAAAVEEEDESAADSKSAATNKRARAKGAAAAAEADSPQKKKLKSDPAATAAAAAGGGGDSKSSDTYHVRGVICLSYPYVGMNNAIRDSILKALPVSTVPLLFVSGDRDKMMDLKSFEKTRKAMPQTKHEVMIVKSGDHSLHVVKKVSGLSQDESDAAIIARIQQFVDATSA